MIFWSVSRHFLTVLVWVMFLSTSFPLLPAALSLTRTSMPSGQLLTGVHRETYTAIHDGFNGPSTFDPTDRCLLHAAEPREFHCVERIKSPSFNCLFHLLLQFFFQGDVVHWLFIYTEKPSCERNHLFVIPVMVTTRVGYIRIPTWQYQSKASIARFVCVGGGWYSTHTERMRYMYGVLIICRLCDGKKSKVFLPEHPFPHAEVPSGHPVVSSNGSLIPRPPVSWELIVFLIFW